MNATAKKRAVQARSRIKPSSLPVLPVKRQTELGKRIANFFTP